jgi:hypothetical protein
MRPTKRPSRREVGSHEHRNQPKTSIAQLNQWKARERIERDGAHSNDSLRRRVRAIAEERSLPPADMAKLMYKRISTRDVMTFCEKHKVSADWLLCGDLRGLHRMPREVKATPRGMPEAQRKEVMALFSALSPRMQAVALGHIRELMTRGHL